MPSQQPLAAVTPVADGDDVPEVISKRVDRPPSEDLELPMVFEHLVPPASRVTSRAHTGPMTYSGPIGSVRRSSASSLRMRRASEGSITMNARCSVCGQDHLDAASMFIRQFGSPRDFVRTIGDVVNLDRRIFHINLGQLASLAANDPSASVIIVLEGTPPQISFRIPGHRRDREYVTAIISAVVPVLLVFSTLLMIVGLVSAWA